jgi:hypothetical protein
MTRHLSIEWPDATPFEDRRGGGPIRILAVSDQLDPSLADVRNRHGMGPIDLIVGCGDLDCDDLAFLADAFNAPLVYVLGNHDADARWNECQSYCPDPIGSGSVRREVGIALAGLSWPGRRGRRVSRSERTAWGQALRLTLRRLGRREPVILVSHVPPRGAGDCPTDRYHRGFAGYRWLMRRLRPPLWLHGHTPLAATDEWYVDVGETAVVNATGSVVIEIWAPGSWGSNRSGSRASGTPAPGSATRGSATRGSPAPASRGPQPRARDGRG